eukprot:m.24011 g.24011  ORF g.24011 m.24011 type:complete len:798 (+) comp14446_c0_seq2:56-2449(+)
MHFEITQSPLSGCPIQEPIRLSSNRKTKIIEILQTMTAMMTLWSLLLVFNAVQVPVASAPTMLSGLSIGTDELTFVLSNSTQAHWGCLDGVYVRGDTNATERGLFIGGPEGDTPLWQLTLTACNESFPSGFVLQSCTVVCKQKYLVNHSTSTTDGSVTANLRWETCATPLLVDGVAKIVDVDVSVTILKGVSTWGATVHKHAAGVCLQSFTLPDLRTLRMTAGHEDLFMPYMFGAQGSCEGGYEDILGEWMPDVCSNPGGCSDKANKEITMMPNGWERTMAFTSWMTHPVDGEAGFGLYVGSHDPMSRLKLMPIACLGPWENFTSAGLRAMHFPDSFNDASVSSFTIPYDVVVASFVGGWWDAAQLYREWVLPNAHWTRKGNISQRDDVPKWTIDAPVWMKLNGDDPMLNATFEKVDSIREMFGGNNSIIGDLGVHWYSWNTETFDSKYPVYDAKPGFGAAVSRLQQPLAGITARVVPYTNGRLWDPTDGLTDLDAATCRGRNQSAYHEVYGSGVKFNVMDPSKQLMQETWSDAVGKIATVYNTSGVYTDQISCSHSETLALMAEKVGKDRVIISESHDQSMMADLHSYLSIYGWIGQMKCSTVLAWQAIYGGWSINVGDIRYPHSPRIQDNVTGKLRFNDTEAAAWRAITAQNFVAGGVMGWFESASERLNMLGLETIDMDFVRLLLTTKVSNAKYLTHGRLWRSPRWLIQPPTMKLHDYGYMEKDPNQYCVTSVILAECWKANDETFALVAVNHGTTTLDLHASINLAPTGEAPNIVTVNTKMQPRSTLVQALVP